VKIVGFVRECGKTWYRETGQKMDNIKGPMHPKGPYTL